MTDLEFSVEAIASALARAHVDMGLLPEEAWEEAKALAGHLELDFPDYFATDVSERVERGGF